MLGYFNFSITGLSHQEKEPKVCQDANRVEKLSNGWIVAAIADGVGSAAHAEIGAWSAVNTVVNTVVTRILDLIAAYKESWNPENLKKYIREGYQEAMREITNISQKEGNPIADYETTLTTVIYNGSDIVFGQSGDGGILVLYNSGEVDSITTVQKGNAFNEVVPLRAGDSSWVFGRSYQPVAALLMMTDGIYDVACPPVLAKTEQPVRVNYVRQFMDRNLIPVESELDFADLQNMAKEFYENPETGSKKITDDKTMVGIINTDVLPCVKEDAYYKTPDYSSIREEQLKKLYEKSETQVREAEFTHHSGLKKIISKVLPHHQDPMEKDELFEERKPQKDEKQAEPEGPLSPADSPGQTDAVILDEKRQASDFISPDTATNDLKKKESLSEIIDAEEYPPNLKK